MALEPEADKFCLDPSALHTLAILADSALPLGSFAYSSGLESFLSHKRLRGRDNSNANPNYVSSYLPLSLQSIASTSLPFVLAAHKNPERITELDNDADASTICMVARRASVAQGRALLAVWERSFSPHSNDADGDNEAAKHLEDFITKTKQGEQDVALNMHFAPLYGLFTRCLNVDAYSSAYLFLFGHAKTIISAAVRASQIGPYQAQKELADPMLKQIIQKLVQEYWDSDVNDVAQTVPSIDLWMGRHEKLYSRIFNS